MNTSDFYLGANLFLIRVTCPFKRMPDLNPDPDPVIISDPQYQFAQFPPQPILLMRLRYIYSIFK